MPLNWDLSETSLIGWEDGESYWKCSKREEELLKENQLLYAITHWLYYLKGKNNYGERGWKNGLTVLEKEDISSFMESFEDLFIFYDESIIEPLKKEVKALVKKWLIGLKVWATR